MACQARPSGLHQQRGEALHPPEQRDVINLDASLGQQFLEIAVRQSVPQVPADRQDDDLGREPEPRERRPTQIDRLTEAGAAHRGSLADRLDPPMQQCPSGCPRSRDRRNVREFEAGRPAFAELAGEDERMVEYQGVSLRRADDRGRCMAR